jgi:hypothetical protein
VSVVVPIVEGHSEVASVPVLLRRIFHRRRVFEDRIQVDRPIRVHRYGVPKEGQLERAIELAALRGCDAVLVLLDANSDCPAELGPALLRRARQARPGILAWVVIAKSEFESWFVGSIESLRGVRGIAADAMAPQRPEEIRGAKEWLSNQMPQDRPYLETDDQPALADRFDLDAARTRCPSFDKFVRDVEEMIATLGQRQKAG